MVTAQVCFWLTLLYQYPFATAGLGRNGELKQSKDSFAIAMGSTVASPPELRNPLRPLPSQQLQKYRQDDDYVTLRLPSYPLFLAKPFELELTFKGRVTRPIAISQTASEDPLHSERMFYYGEQILPVQHRFGGQTYINFTPMSLGKVAIRLQGTAVDGAFFDKDFTTFVQESPDGPKEFSAAETPWASIDLNLERPEAVLVRYRATYAGVDEPIFIKAEYVHFNVKTEGGRRS